MVGMHFSPPFLPLSFLRKYCAVARAPGTTSRRDTLTVTAIKLLSTRTLLQCLSECWYILLPQIYLCSRLRRRADDTGHNAGRLYRQ